VAVGYSILIAAMLVAAPELLIFAPLWLLWTLVTLAAITTYIGGDALRRWASKTR